MAGTSALGGRIRLVRLSIEPSRSPTLRQRLVAHTDAGPRALKELRTNGSAGVETDDGRPPTHSEHPSALHVAVFAHVSNSMDEVVDEAGNRRLPLVKSTSERQARMPTTVSPRHPLNDIRRREWLARTCAIARTGAKRSWIASTPVATQELMIPISEARLAGR